MSQRYFRSNNLQVQAGYDRPLDYFFLVITAEDADNPVYSNLSDPEGPDLDFEQITDRLANVGCVWPETLFDDLLKDYLEAQKGLASNTAHDYGEIQNVGAQS